MVRVLCFFVSFFFCNVSICCKRCFLKDLELHLSVEIMTTILDTLSNHTGLVKW